MQKRSKLTLLEREKLYALREQKKSFREIGILLDRSHTSLSREVARNRNQNTGEYIPCKADKKAKKRETKQRERSALKSPFVLLYVRRRLRRGWSPETIKGRLNRDHPKYNIGTETIYRYIYKKKKHPKEKLFLLLKLHRGRRLQKDMRKVKRTLIPNRVLIEMRPNTVNQRFEFGHVETDLMEGVRSDQQVVSVIVERKTRYTKLDLLSSKKAFEKTDSMVNTLVNFPVKSITTDNGVENTNHQRWSEKLGCPVYFTNPYHSWEKGTVENTIGRLRYFVPKRQTLSHLNRETLKAIERHMNNTPRKCLEYKTPAEALQEELNKLQIRQVVRFR